MSECRLDRRISHPYGRWRVETDGMLIIRDGVGPSMPQEPLETRYVVAAELTGETAQNPQELISMWGGIREDCAAMDVEIVDAWAVFGDHDFIAVVDPPDRRDMLRTSLIMQRRGLRTTSMPAISTESFASVVSDR